MRITPDNITSLNEGEIFGFGANEAGIHGGGAAKLAHQKFEAEWHVGFGLTGKCFAIPTKDRRIQSLAIIQIKHYVDRFIEYAKEHPEYKFLVTEIGCGLAGFVPEQIAPLFKDAVDIENIFLPKRFWNVLNPA